MSKLTAKTRSGAETRIDRQAIDEFTATLTCPPILPDAPDYGVRVDVESRRVRAEGGATLTHPMPSGLSAIH